MSRRTSRSWTPGSVTAVCSLFTLTFLLGGIWVSAIVVEYRLFGLVDGLAALLILYVLLNTGVVSWPVDAWGGLVLIYLVAATAQLVAMLLPPPGVVEWIVLGLLLLFAGGASFGVHRSRVVLGLGLAAVALAALRYSILPFVWARTRLPETPIIDLREVSEGVKGFFVAYTPGQPITHLIAFAAILAWVLAVWIQWPPEPEGHWLERLSRADRDRLLFWLLRGARGEGDSVSVEQVRGYLEGDAKEE